MNNTVLISEIEEVGADVGEPDCKLINPYIITTSDQKITIQENVATLSPWMKRFSKETTFMISSDKILTLTEPIGTLLEKYKESTK